MLRSIRQLQQFLLHRPKCNWRAISEEPGGKDLVSIPGQFPGITGQKFHGTGERLSEGYAAGCWVCPEHISDNSSVMGQSCTDTLITMARPRTCLELLRWATKAPLLGYHIQPSTSHLDSALS